MIAAATPSVNDDPAYQAFSALVARIEIALDTETAALRDNRAIDLTAIAFRKRQGLLELSRILPRLLDSQVAGAIRHRLSRLAETLERNRRALDVQLRAVREVSDIVARAMREADSDGTYSLITARQ